MTIEDTGSNASATGGADQGDDAEIEAIASISRILRTLGEDERRRVIEWASRKYGASIPAGPPHSQVALVGTGAVGSAVVEQVAAYEHFAELYNRARPTTDVQRALTASYWAQEVEGKKGFSSLDVNARLKEISAGLGHIADAMGALQTRRPALVIQLRKSGRARQARKTYLVTPEGIAAVRIAITNGAFRPDTEAES